MKKILVTGGSGKAGRATIKTLLENNYDVFNVDLEKSIGFIKFKEKHEQDALAN